MTEKQRKFAEEYVKSLNGTEAYMKAYGIKNKEAAAKRAWKLKNNAEVGEYIKELSERATFFAGIDCAKVVELLGAIAFTSPADFAKIENHGEKQSVVWLDFDNIPDDIKKAIGVIKNTPTGVVVETLDRMKAIDLLMKYMGIAQTGNAVVIEGEAELE